MRIAALLFTLMMITGAAQAQHNVGAAYINLGYGFHSGEITDIGDVDSNGIVFRSGYDFSRYAGFEAEGFLGLEDDSVDVMTMAGLLTVDAEVKYSATAFIVGRYPVGRTGSSIFVRLGYGQTEYDLGAAGIPDKVTHDGFAYGIGGEWLVHGLNGVRADYASMNNGAEDVFSVSYVRRF